MRIRLRMRPRTSQIQSNTCSTMLADSFFRLKCGGATHCTITCSFPMSDSQLRVIYAECDADADAMQLSRRGSGALLFTRPHQPTPPDTFARRPTAEAPRHNRQRDAAQGARRVRQRFERWGWVKRCGGGCWCCMRCMMMCALHFDACLGCLIPLALKP